MSGGGEAARVYLAAIRREAERVLGLLDREEFSPTFGCMDRTFWAWKFTDFPAARFQEGLCFLAFLHSTAFEGNPHHRHPRLLRWIAGGFDFWARIQRRSGDFDEAYPFERSLAATAFTTFYLGEAWELLDGALPPDSGARFRTAVARAAGWLCRNDETHGFLSNHLAAAAAALRHAHRITGEERFAKRSDFFLDRVLSHQSPEGWYEEYGGADPGYQTHGSFYLARLLEMSGEARLAGSLARSFEFLAHFVHPDRSLGGEYASRNTKTYYPAAFERMADRDPRAAWIASEMLPAVEGRSAAGLGSVDAFNTFPLLNNYVSAYLAAARRSERPASTGPSPEPAWIHFPAAGILKVRKRRYDAVVGLAKGGVVQVFDRERGKLVFSSCGYVGRRLDGSTISSQWPDPGRRVDLAGDEVRIEGRFFRVSRPVMSPMRFLAFRLFATTVGRLPALARWLKKVLVRTLIYRSREVDLRLSRQIRFGEGGLEIRDRLVGGPGLMIRDLAEMETFTTIHMGSARYFVPGELACAREPEGLGAVDPSTLDGGATRTRRVDLDADPGGP